jgi:pimeloyl-ACP methyl ester carboxylesterase
MPYLEVAGLRTWHEVAGEGAPGTGPVVLLHGGLAGASSWGGQVPALAAAGYRVYLPERRGHAHTPDVAGPLTYSVMADDTIAYLDQVIGGPANLVGWSDGAVVGLLVAQRRPDLAARLVLIGQYLNSAGQVPGSVLEDLSDAADDPFVSFLREEYGQTSPDGPDHFDVVYAKTIQMWNTEPELDLAILRDVDLPSLVLQGDRDVVTVAHSAEIAATLPRGRLAVLPGTHLLPVESPRLVSDLLIAFLRADDPPAS